MIISVALRQKEHSLKFYFVTFGDMNPFSVRLAVHTDSDPQWIILFLQVMQAFRTGGYNTLVSTCVGEEGLDIGDVDLIVCFDAHKSPIRLVQRMGRTGRKRQGRIVMLVTEGKEEQVRKVSTVQWWLLNHTSMLFLCFLTPWQNVLVTEGKEEQVRKVSTVQWWLLTHTSKLFS